MHTEEQKVEAYKKLPEEVRDFISSLNIVALIKSLQSKYQLHVDQLGILSDEIGLVIFGLTPSAQFIDSIKRKLGVGQETAEAITREVNESVFLPIRQAMRKISAASDEPGQEDNGVAVTGAEKTKTRPSDSPEPDLFEQKMASAFVLPRVETASQDKSEASTEQPESNTSPDPYRESIN